VPYLRLIEISTGRLIETRGPLRLGRDPEATVALAGDDVGVVSGTHAEIHYVEGTWRLSDLGSRNGTFLNGERLTADASLRVGDHLSLGATGPVLSVAAVMDDVAPTIAEQPGVAPAPAAEKVRAYGVSLRDTKSGKHYEGRGMRIRLGRGRECEIRLEPTPDLIVSRVHTEFTIGAAGGLIVRDAGSKHGTFVNGVRLTRPLPVRLGDLLMLGDGGPTLVLEGVGTSPMMPVARRSARSRPSAFLRALVEERFRWVAALGVPLLLLLGGAVYGVYWLLSTEVEQSETLRRSAADSARADMERLRGELAAARAAAAPVSQVESLRAQLESARTRTTELRGAFERAQTAVAQQLVDAEGRRVAAQSEVQRLRDELAAAERRTPSRAVIDSLRQAVTIAEQRNAGFDAKLRAIRGTDFASIAQQCQGAVVLVTVELGHQYFSGTGFVISPDGYMLTNWHVVADTNVARADTIWITVADQSDARLADVIATSAPRDIALLKVRNYKGLYLSALDWRGLNARQGEPAALIGFPAGAGFARSGSRTSLVRTSMTAGIISRVTDDLIQFDGMTIGGSSGSPLFNANGEVISIHRAGLPQAPGFALSVPLKHAIPLLPEPLKQRLGVP
jgi:pSer/pThr/pTyr-binding forkhead associated (FHA) protein/S1-C subfamily serine protease